MDPSAKNVENLNNSDYISDKPKLSEAEKHVEGLIATKEITGKAARLLSKKLDNDPEKDSVDTKSTKELLEMYKKRYAEASEELENLSGTKIKEYTEEVIDKSTVFASDFKNELFSPSMTTEQRLERFNMIKDGFNDGLNEDEIRTLFKIEGELSVDLSDDDRAEKMDIIREGIKDGLSEEVILSILNADYEKIEGMDKSEQEKVYKSIKHYESMGIIDSESGGGSFSEGMRRLLELFGFKFDENGAGVGGESININMGNLDFKGMPESTQTILKNVLNIGANETGIHESTGGADKYFKETGFNLSAKNVPWCAAFVNWTLKKAGINGTGSNAAKSFINGSGYGHVGFKLGDGLLGGNQSDQVSVKPLNTSKIAGWVLPNELGNSSNIHKKGDIDFDVDKIPDGAIIVYNRNVSNKIYS